MLTSKIHRLLAPLTLTLALAACDSETPEADPDEEPNADDTPLTPELAAGRIVATTTLLVEPHKRGCVGVDYGTCLIAPQADGQGYTYESVWGFDFEWGHRYTLEVNIVKMPDDVVDGDGSIWNAELVEIVEDQIDVAEEFELPTFAFAIEPGASSGALLDQTPVTCAPELCDAIAAIDDDPISPMVRVRFGDVEPLPLVAVELLEGG